MSVKKQNEKLGDIYRLTNKIFHYTLSRSDKIFNILKYARC